jgi:pimeloyl-ACP methyl ester carboxylesterase
MNQIDLDGIRLEIRQIASAGQLAPKSTIVFLHEGLGSVSLWTQRGIDWPERVCAAAGRAGLVYSRRGYGRSDPAVRPLSARYMHHEAWKVLPALLARLEILQPVLLGHSDGATIALLHASRFEVSACIAMAPHVLVEDIALKAIVQAQSAFESGQLRERLARHHADVEGAFRQWNDVWLSSEFRRFDIRADCQRITSPLLLLQGLNDEYGTLRQLDEIAACAPHARQRRLPDCGHSPHRDQPQASLDAVVDFLDPLP